MGCVGPGFECWPDDLWEEETASTEIISIRTCFVLTSRPSRNVRQVYKIAQMGECSFLCIRVVLPGRKPRVTRGEAQRYFEDVERRPARRAERTARRVSPAARVPPERGGRVWDYDVERTRVFDVNTAAGWKYGAYGRALRGG